MSEPKHSPGPWKVATTDDGDFGIVSRYDFYIDRDKKAEEAILNFVQDGLDKEGL